MYKCRRDGELSAGRKAARLAVRPPHPAAAWRNCALWASFVRHTRLPGAAEYQRRSFFMEIFKTPFSHAYWQCAARDAKKLRTVDRKSVV